MKNNLSVVRSPEQSVKTAFLSYYISVYNSVTNEIGFEDAPVSIEEIYDFIQDLKHEAGKTIPEIRREDISLCFQLLKASGICKA